MNVFRFVFSKTFIKNLFYILIVVAVLFGVTVFWLGAYTGHNEFVEVPALKGKTIETIQLELEEINLGYEVIDSVYSEGERGTILEQIPEAGAKVKEGRMVYLTVNASSAPMKTLNVKQGESLRVAATKLGILGIEFDTRYQPDICNDCVIKVLYKGKEAPEGTTIRKGERVTLVLGERGNQKVPVPSLFGLSLDSARQKLVGASLSIGYPFYDADIVSSEDSLAARIYSQSPKADSEPSLRIGSQVDVWLTLRPLNKDTLSRIP